jgi:hypothetical protein
MDPADAPAVRRLLALPLDDLFELYFVAATTMPDKADVPALALRQRGRAGELNDRHVELLKAALEASPNLLCAGHLAKAAAAIGRPAQPAAPALCACLQDAVISNDADYWSFDGAVCALGYLGGADARTMIDALATEEPSRAVRSDSIYQGDMPKAARASAFSSVLQRARALWEQDAPGCWTTQHMKPRGGVAVAATKRKPWMR